MSVNDVLRELKKIKQEQIIFSDVLCKIVDKNDYMVRHIRGFINGITRAIDIIEDDRLEEVTKYKKETCKCL